MTFGINSTSMAKSLLKIMEPLGQGVSCVTIDNKCSKDSKDKNSSSILLFRRLLYRDGLPSRRYQRQHKCIITGNNKGGLGHKTGHLQTIISNKDRAG
jgi:hypothetical protein